MEYCSNCGAELGAGANFCPNCGAVKAVAAPVETFEPSGGFSGGGNGQSGGAQAAAPVGARQVSPQKIENHLIKSIIATACCCVPVGIVGIIYAAKVDALLKHNDLAAAAEASKKAGLWSSLAIGIGLITNAMVVILSIVYQFREGYQW